MAHHAHVFGPRACSLLLRVAAMANMSAVRHAAARMDGVRHSGQRRKDDDGAKAIATKVLFIEGTVDADIVRARVREPKSG